MVTTDKHTNTIVGIWWKCVAYSKTVNPGLCSTSGKPILNILGVGKPNFNTD